MAYRDFVDPTGIVWQVWDTYPPSAANVRSDYAQGWLSFRSAAERRRLQPVPRGWEDATDEDLRGWLEAAHPVHPAELQRLLRPTEPTPAALDAPATGAPDPPPEDSWHRTRAVVERARRVIRLVNSAIHRTNGERDREE